MIWQANTIHYFFCNLIIVRHHHLLLESPSILIKLSGDEKMNLICHIEEALSLNQSTLQLYVGIFKVCSLKLWPKISLTRPFTQKQNNNRKLARIAGGAASASIQVFWLVMSYPGHFLLFDSEQGFQGFQMFSQHIPPPQWPGFCAHSLCVHCMCIES